MNELWKGWGQACIIAILGNAAIAKQLREKRFAFDVELTFLLIKNRFKIREMPINWEEVPGSKVKILRDSIRMFSGVLRMRRNLGSLKAHLASER